MRARPVPDPSDTWPAFHGWQRHSAKIHVAVLEVVGRLLDFVLMIYVPIGETFRPGEVEYIFHALQVHGKPLQPIGDFARNGLAVHAADLLKIGELRHLHAVQPHFPAQAPGAQRRILPIILDETNVILLQVEAELFAANPDTVRGYWRGAGFSTT